MGNNTLTDETNAKSIVGCARSEFCVIRRCKLAECFDVFEFWDVIHGIENNCLVFFFFVGNDEFSVVSANVLYMLGCGLRGMSVSGLSMMLYIKAEVVVVTYLVMTGHSITTYLLNCIMLRDAIYVLLLSVAKKCYKL
jgi:hypothetical protein